MPGIYIHIPFCKKACTYCDFHFSTSTKHKEPVVNAIIKELELRKSYLEENNINTIYFGGGTPSLLSSSEINRIINGISKCYNVTTNAEITLEANPDDLTEKKIKDLHNAGINRLSIGVQSFFDRDLIFMNRSHNAQQAKKCVETAKTIGFNNISIDLIYGIPNQTNEDWEQNIKIAIGLDVQHISSYCLTIEEKTALAYLTKKNPKLIVKDEIAEQQFYILIKKLQSGGFEHYETSNFAKKGYISKHNSSYWLGEKYVGIGPSAHSYNGISRQWNVANNIRYLKSIEKNEIPCEVEILTQKQKYNEYILTSIRTKWGINPKYIFENFNKKTLIFFEKELKKQEKLGFLIKNNNSYVLTNKAKFLSDKIAVDLFLD